MFASCSFIKQVPSELNTDEPLYLKMCFFERLFSGLVFFCIVSIYLPEVCLLWQAGRKGNFLHIVPLSFLFLYLFSYTLTLAALLLSVERWYFSVKFLLHLVARWPSSYFFICSFLWRSNTWESKLQQRVQTICYASLRLHRVKSDVCWLLQLTDHQPGNVGPRFTVWLVGVWLILMQLHSW